MGLTVEGLCCRRAGRPVLNGIGFVLESGEALAVFGRNGSGKSTLLACLAGAVRADAGRVHWAEAGDPDAALPERIHLLGHRDGLKPSLTSAENLLFAAALLGGRGLDPAAALARVGLPGAAALPVAYLSAGQRRRVALARLLVAPRPLWLLDEPATALDTAGQALLEDMLGEHRRAGGLVVASAHGPLALPGARTLRLGRDPSGREHAGPEGSGPEGSGPEGSGPGGSGPEGSGGGPEP